MGPGLLGRRTPNPLLPSWDHGSQLSVPRAAGELAVRPSASQGSWGHRRAELAAALHDLELPPAWGHGASLGLPDLGAGGAGAGVGGVEAQRGACSELPAWGCRVLAAAPSVPGARGPAVAWSLGLAALTLGGRSSHSPSTRPPSCLSCLSCLSCRRQDAALRHVHWEPPGQRAVWGSGLVGRTHAPGCSGARRRGCHCPGDPGFPLHTCLFNARGAWPVLCGLHPSPHAISPRGFSGSEEDRTRSTFTPGLDPSLRFYVCFPRHGLLLSRQTCPAPSGRAVPGAE